MDKKALKESFYNAILPLSLLGQQVLGQRLTNRVYRSTVFHAKVGLADIFTAGLGLLFAGIFSIVVLAVFGGFATIASIWPAANVTKITTNIANAVVSGAAFLSVLILLIEVGFLFVVVGLVAGIVESAA